MYLFFETFFYFEIKFSNVISIVKIISYNSFEATENALVRKYPQENC